MALEKEIFENNKITEALCQFRFEESIDTSKFNLFFEELKKDGVFVEKQDIPMLHLSFNVSEATPVQTTNTGLKISNANKDSIIQIYSDNISIHQVGNYKTWEIFRDGIFKILDALKNIFDCNFIRIDLRTINNFDFELNEDLKKYFNIFLNTPNTVIQPYNFNFAIEQMYEPANKFGVIRLNGFNQNNIQNVVFDLSYVEICTDSKIKISDTNRINDSLQEGHIKLSALFKSSITEETKKIIK